MDFEISLILATGSKSGLQVIFLLVLFAIIVAVAYYATYYISKFQQGNKRNGNLQIIEAISVGSQKSIQIVRIGKTYAVIGVTKTHIEFIQTLSAEDLIINKEDPLQSVVPFKQILNQYR